MKNIKKLISGMLLSVMILSSFPGKPVKAERNINVIRIAGADRFETAEKIADKVIELGGNANEYALANGLNFPDALSGGAYCAKFKLPLLLSDGKSVPEKFRNKPVTIFGGEGVVNPDGINLKKRLAGADRFETSKAIAMDGFNKTMGTVMVSGFKFPDALSSIAFSIKNDFPVLLTNTIEKSCTVPTMEFVEHIAENNIKDVLNNPQKIDIIGIEYLNPVDSQGIGYDLRHITGKNRYETSVLLAKEVSPNPKTVIVASGLNYADALSGSALAGVLKDSPIILTNPNDLSEEVREYLSNSSIENIYILGGYGAVSERVEKQIKGEKVEPTLAKLQAAMPKWSVFVKDDVFMLVNQKIINELDFYPIQKAIDDIAKHHLKAWVNASATWVEYKAHGDGKSIVLEAHSSRLVGRKIKGTDYVYLSDKNGVVKKYVRCNTIKNKYPEEFLSKEDWNFIRGKGGDYIKFTSCNDLYAPDGIPLYDEHIFKLAE